MEFAELDTRLTMISKVIKQLTTSKLIKNGFWLFVLQVFNTVVPMFTLPYITRILGPSGYGDFSLALNWILYLQVIVEYGFGYWGARKIATSGREELQKIYSSIITARIALMIFSLLQCVLYICLVERNIHILYVCVYCFLWLLE